MEVSLDDWLVYTFGEICNTRRVLIKCLPLASTLNHDFFNFLAIALHSGLGEQETHSLAPALMSNILKMCHDDLNTYHSFSCLLKFLRSHLFVDLLNADTDSVQKVSSRTCTQSLSFF